MKLHKFFLIALLAGSLVAIGCGDSGSSNGGDDIDPNELCNIEACAVDSEVGRAAKAVCVDEINDCIATGELTEAQCITLGTETCTV
ncbi:MAG: hypothetical protein JRJ80_18815 [Deltaproteobacteria bacterium]|nr:hypothetical protein [Deltaproteobacteria bacterium]MBW2162278.1 hypothetical protein [Deltaproteobacteria bacterium]